MASAGEEYAARREFVLPFTEEEESTDGDDISPLLEEIDENDDEHFKSIDSTVGRRGSIVGMEGRGVLPNEAQRAAVVEGLRKLKEEGLLQEESNWMAADVDGEDFEDELQIFIHQYAIIQYTSTITSQIFTRSQTKDSSMVKVRFTIDGKKQPHAGVVEYYARAKLPNKSVVRIVLCKFYEPEKEIGDEGCGFALCCKVYEGNDSDRTWTADSRETPYPVLLTSIDGKYTRFDRPKCLDVDK